MAEGTERAVMMGQMVDAVCYMAMSMRTTTSLHRAVQFAARNVGDPMATRLRQLIVDVELRKFDTLEDAFIDLARTYDPGNEEFQEALRALRTAELQVTEEGIERALERATTTAFEGARRRVREFADGLQRPVFVLFSLGVVLPLMVGSMLPLMSVGGLDAIPALSRQPVKAPDLFGKPGDGAFVGHEAAQARPRIFDPSNGDIEGRFNPVNADRDIHFIGLHVTGWFGVFVRRGDQEFARVRLEIELFVDIDDQRYRVQVVAVGCVDHQGRAALGHQPYPFGPGHLPDFIGPGPGRVDHDFRGNDTLFGFDLPTRVSGRQSGYRRVGQNSAAVGLEVT